MARKSKKGRTLDRSQKDRSEKRGVVPSQTQSRGAIAVPAFVSAALLWAAFPPLDLNFLAWFAPLGWLTIVRRELPLSRRDYGVLWLSGCLFWLATLQGIRLAYWPLYFGWIALSLYLAIYIPLFVAAARTLTRQLHFPFIAAVPVAWVGLELIRAYVLTGFAANMLVHTQARHPLVIQIADQLGGYGVSFMMLVVSAAIYQTALAWRRREWFAAVMPVGLAAGVLLLMFAYGAWRLAEGDRLAAAPPLLRVLLVQENAPTMFESDALRVQEAWTSYLQKTQQLAAEHGEVALVVWPESTFSGGSPWVEPRLPNTLPEELRDFEQQVRERINQWGDDFEIKIGMTLAAARNERYSMSAPTEAGSDQSDRNWPHLLLGSDAVVIDAHSQKHFNAALFVAPNGKLIDRYDKMHLVLFGEYIPFGPLMQWLRNIFPIDCAPGKQAKSFRIEDVCISPNICFESTLPRFLSWQVRQLSADGDAPDVLLNITNDSWFRGSSILDHHLACSIVCAVENRRPLLVAANSGLSASIDGSGRVLEVTGRLVSAGILAEPRRDGRSGLVQRVGYPLAWICGLLTTFSLCSGWFFRRRPRGAI